MTQTAREIHRSLRMMQRMSGFRTGLICGNAGIGKTIALRAFQQEELHVGMVTAAGGEDDPKAMAEDLCGRFNIWGWKNMSLTARRKALVEKPYDVAILIVDEAQHFKLTALEWLRRLCEKAGCDLVLAGDEKLYMVAISNAQIGNLAVLPRLFNEVFPTDVQAIAAAHGLDRDGIRRDLEGVAFMRGGIRHMCNVIELATAFSNGGLVTRDHILSAIAQPGLSKGK